MIVYLPLIWIGWRSRPKVNVVNDNWTKAENDVFKRLMDEHGIQLKYAERTI